MNNNKKNKRILIACEFSGIVREEFKKVGWDAWSCDLLDTEIPGQHYKCDIRDVLYKDWDMLIAHPPCTRLCNSGVRWISERNLWKELDEAANFFNLFKSVNIDRVCIENPIPHKYAVQKIGKYTQIVQPWQFGHYEKKATCFWLKNLPKLIPTCIVDKNKAKQSSWLASPGPDRSKFRSRTFLGIGKAMAEQWGKI